MSKIAGALSDGTVKNGVVGACISLGCYVLLQFFSAYLVCSGIVGEGAVYSAVCISAAVSSFMGCCFGVVRTGENGVLSAFSVVVVFLVLTIMIGVCVNEIGVIGAGLAGVGMAMVGGGLAAAMFCGAMRGRVRREKGRVKHRRR